MHIRIVWRVVKKFRDPGSVIMGLERGHPSPLRLGSGSRVSGKGGEDAPREQKPGCLWEERTHLSPRSGKTGGWAGRSGRQQGPGEGTLWEGLVPVKCPCGKQTRRWLVMGLLKTSLNKRPLKGSQRKVAICGLRMAQSELRAACCTLFGLHRGAASYRHHCT